MENLKLADPTILNTKSLDVDILIGNDYYSSLVTGEVKKLHQKGLMAMNSKFGWLLSGPVPSYNNQKISMACNLIETTMESEELNKLLPRFWDIDVIGVTDRDHSIDKTLNNFQESVKYNHSNRRYIVRLPWKQNKHELPDNYHLSKARLISLIKSLAKKDSGLIMNYDSQIRDQIELDFIEEVKNPKIYSGICHFIPHFPVFKTDPNATTR